MRVLLPIKVGLAVVLLGGLFGGASKATTIYYQAVSLNASQQLWQYDYYVTGDTFGVNQDFTIDFNYQTYSKLQNGETGYKHGLECAAVAAGPESAGSRRIRRIVAGEQPVERSCVSS